LEEFAIDLELTIYKPSGRALEVFTASSLKYKQPTATPLDHL